MQKPSYSRSRPSDAPMKLMPLSWLYDQCFVLTARDQERLTRHLGQRHRDTGLRLDHEADLWAPAWRGTLHFVQILERFFPHHNTVYDPRMRINSSWEVEITEAAWPRPFQSRKRTADVGRDTIQARASESCPAYYDIWATLHNEPRNELPWKL
ncbi:hypothetical protein MN608_10366 [Microdochium nivale]|nr:hypothetical protein MN608_10366 [Microdochium nivale]